MITNLTHAEKLMDKAKFTSAEGHVYVSDLSQASQHTHAGERGHLSFMPYSGIKNPFALRRELGFTVF
jgi:hypothetical protein